jgi:hypothetical protein
MFGLNIGLERFPHEPKQRVSKKPLFQLHQGGKNLKGFTGNFSCVYCGANVQYNTKKHELVCSNPNCPEGNASYGWNPLRGCVWAENVKDHAWTSVSKAFILKNINKIQQGRLCEMTTKKENENLAKYRLRQRIIKEMTLTEEDEIVFGLMNDNPSLVDFWGKDNFEAKARKLYKKFVEER